MTDAELQEEELEVLKSIYEGDSMYSTGGDNKHSYKFGEHATSKSFILEIVWGPTYPTELPGINLSSFYNNHVSDGVKESIIKAVTEEAEQNLGMSMTYTLFEWVKENQESLLDKQPDFVAVVTDNLEKTVLKDSSEEPEEKRKKEKKEQLTKGQKRNAWKKGGLNEGDRERGWNWVDVIKHLHQTGSGPTDE